MKTLFTNDKFFFIVMLVDVIGGFMYSVIGCICYPIAFVAYVPLLFSAVCSLVLYISYQKHSKNVMKGMMSALLTARFMSAVSSMAVVEITADYICAPISILFTLLMFINHMVINSQHHSSPKNIKLNQLFAVLLSVNSIVWSMIWLLRSASTIEIILKIVGILVLPAAFSIVVCVESRLDAYRLDRESAGWTEEKGYPEGYIHRKDR